MLQLRSKLGLPLALPAGTPPGGTCLAQTPPWAPPHQQTAWFPQRTPSASCRKDSQGPRCRTLTWRCQHCRRHSRCPWMTSAQGHSSGPLGRRATECAPSSPLPPPSPPRFSLLPLLRGLPLEDTIVGDPPAPFLTASYPHQQRRRSPRFPGRAPPGPYRPSRPPPQGGPRPPSLFLRPGTARSTSRRCRSGARVP